MPAVNWPVADWFFAICLDLLSVHLSHHTNCMQSSYLMGIDIGTGSTKAVALDHAGKVIFSTQDFYTISGKTEQAIAPVWEAFCKTIREMVAALQGPPLAVSLSSAMHSIMAVESNGAPLTNAVLWSDTRSTGIARELRQSALGKQIYTATGTPLHSMSPLCKIRWWQQNSADIFTRAAKFISIKEAIWHRLFGEFVVDHSLASATGLFNFSQLQWDETALCFAGISPQQLSAPVPTDYKKTGLSSEMAASLQLLADTPFFIGGSDGCLANLGSLCLKPDKAAITIGTSAAVRITTTKPVQNPERMIFSYLLDEKTFVCGGAINNGGNVFQWLLNNLFAQHKEINTFEALFGAIASVPAGAGGLLFLPYLHGERAPIWDEESCGVFFGLRTSHQLPHFARAAAEGVCFALYHILSSLEDVCGQVSQITISGGLVQSPVMMQLLADVTGKKLVVQQAEDASAIGAAFLARKALGLVADYSSIAENEGVVFQPRPEETAHYRQLFSVYQSLYPALQPSMHLLQTITS
jgi:gluconokinase